MSGPRLPRPVLKVGVLLAPPADDLGTWLAGAAAFDAAGADSLWIDVTGDTGLDPLTVTAALASLTVRSTLVTAAPDPADARTLATLGRLSRGRFALWSDHLGPAAPSEVAVYHRLEDGGFVREVPDGEPERWMPTAWAGGRAAWRTAIAQAAGSEAAGLLVRAGPALLDVLRNPGDAGDRHDLQLAQG